MPGVATEDPPLLQLEERWRESFPGMVPRHPEPEYALRGAVPRAGRMEGQAYWRTGRGEVRRPLAVVWREHSEDPVRLPVKASWDRTGSLSRGGLVIGSVRGYHASHGAAELPDPERPACWSNSQGSTHLLKPSPSLVPPWKTAAILPARGTWATAIPRWPRVQTSADTAVPWWEQASAHPCLAPGGAPESITWTGHLRRAALPVPLVHVPRMGSARQQPADWRKSAISQQAVERPAWRLSGSYAGGARSPMSVWQMARIAPVEWRTETPLARQNNSARTPGASPAAGHWADHPPEAASAAAVLSAGVPGSPASSFTPEGFSSRGHAPAGLTLPRVRISYGGRIQDAGQAWTGEEAARGALRTSRPGAPAQTAYPLPRLGLWLGCQRFQPAIASIHSGGRAGAERLAREGFWPSTAFVSWHPETVRLPALGTQGQDYVWRLAVAVPAWRSTGPGHALPRPEVRPWTAERSTAPPRATLPAAIWRPPAHWLDETRPVAATPARAVLSIRWRPESSAYRVTGAGRADWSRVEAGPAEWSGAGVSDSTVLLPAGSAVSWVSRLGRQFEFEAGLQHERIRAAGAGPPHHPERLKLPHLVCRFPRIDRAGSLGPGGGGPSVFRFSGMCREE